MGSRFAAVAAPAYLVLCVLLGGASMAGVIANAVLQVLAVVLILAVLWTRGDAPAAPEARLLRWTVALWAVLVAVMLIPLPEAIWAGLPGRDVYARGLTLLGAEAGWQPLTLDRDATLHSALSILPPMAMFLLVSRLSEDRRRPLAWCIIGLVAVSVVLGVFQLFGGPTSSLRFYRITNVDAAVGFFANTNHLATLLLCALPFVGVVAARAAAGRSERGKKSGILLISIALSIFLVAGIVITGSLAGYGLLLPAGLASLLVYRRAAHGRLTKGWLMALAGVFVLFVGVATLGPISGEAVSDRGGSQASRRVFAERSIEAIKDYIPAGSGLGTFHNVYRLYDDPDRTDRAYVNHAHNDYLEVALELGIPGLLLIALFLFWYGRRAIAVWRRDFRGSGMARAGTVVIGIVLLHSIVDYPIRTAAIAALFGMACALLVPPVSRRSVVSADDEGEEDSGLRHLEAV